jgi:hypothetical protein
MLAGASRIFSGLACALGLILAVPDAALSASETGTVEGYAWIGGETDPGYASLVYGTPESAEDVLFVLFCDMKYKATELTLYVNIDESRVGEKVPLEFSAGGAKAVLDGRFWSDEMIGPFAQATDFKIAPMVEVFVAKGPVTAKTGDVVTTLPEKGRAAATAEFAQACTLD